MEGIGNLIGGIGVFFVGLHLLSTALKRRSTPKAASWSAAPLSHNGLELLLILQNKQKQLEAFEDLLLQFSLSCREWTGNLRSTFQGTFLQGLDFLLHTACEAENSDEATDAEQLVKLTQDKGDVFQSIRNAYLSGEKTMDTQDRTAFLELTSLYERMIWTLGRIATLQLAQKRLAGVADG